MRRFRLSTLMLLIVIAALCVALVVQHDRASRRVAELEAFQFQVSIEPLNVEPAENEAEVGFLQPVKQQDRRKGIDGE